MHDGIPEDTEKRLELTGGYWLVIKDTTIDQLDHRGLINVFHLPDGHYRMF